MNHLTVIFAVQNFDQASKCNSHSLLESKIRGNKGMNDKKEISTVS